MKNFARIKTLFIGLLFVSLHLACNDNDDTIPTVPSTTITSLASQNENLSSLVAALSAADGELPAVLQGEGPFTVLAPTNAAFDEFLDGRALSDIPSDILTQLLLNHVISGKVEAADLAALTSEGNHYTSTLADGAIADTNMSIYFKTEGGVQFNGISTVTAADIQASNGVIHIVDRVIDLPNIVTFATADPRFSTLVEALTISTDFTYVESLQTPNGSEPTPLTVFAPTNDAFDDFLIDQEAANLSDLGNSLKTVLDLHVIPGENVLSSDLVELDGAVIASFGGNDLQIIINADPAGVYGPVDPTNLNPIIIADIQASNGVIHAISRVIRHSR